MNFSVRFVAIPHQKCFSDASNPSYSNSHGLVWEHEWTLTECSNTYNVSLTVPKKLQNPYTNFIGIRQPYKYKHQLRQPDRIGIC